VELVISAFLAYALSGISQVFNDLSGHVKDRPVWTMHPTLGMALFVGATWITRPFYKGQTGRQFAFGLLAVTLQMVILTGFIWGCIVAANQFFDSTFLRIATAAVLMVIGALVVLPLISVLMMPLTLLIAWPLNLLFPLKRSSDVQRIKWCRTCKHHRKSREYEDTLSGLWHSDSMPRSDKLPCKIALETAGVWTRYFSSEPSSRTLFPNDCPSYEPRT